MNLKKKKKIPKINKFYLAKASNVSTNPFQSEKVSAP